jgi:uncharacterized membrane protein HdeD (DUF308 family)
MAVAPADVRHDGTGELDQPAVDTDRLGALWYVFLISGVVSVVIGLVVLAYPDLSLKLLGVFLGIDLLIAGVLMIVRGVAKDGDPDAGPALLLLGTIALIAGLVVIRNPGNTITLLAIAFAIYLIVAGAIALGQALVKPGNRGVRLARGVVLVAAGSVIIAWPDISLKTLVLLTGIALIIQGGVEIGEAFIARSLAKAERAG